MYAVFREQAEGLKFERIALQGAGVQITSAEEIQLCASAAAFCRRGSLAARHSRTSFARWRIIRIPQLAVGSFFPFSQSAGKLVPGGQRAVERADGMRRAGVHLSGKLPFPAYLWIYLCDAREREQKRARIAGRFEAGGHQKFYDCGRADGFFPDARTLRLFWPSLCTRTRLIYCATRFATERETWAQHQLNAGVNPIDLRAQNAFICHFITFSELCGEFLLACCLLDAQFYEYDECGLLFREGIFLAKFDFISKGLMCSVYTWNL